MKRRQPRKMVNESIVEEPNVDQFNDFTLKKETEELDLDDFDKIKLKPYVGKARAELYSSPPFIELETKLMELVVREGTNIFACTKCPKISANRSHSLEHAESHLERKHSDWTWTCECGKTFYKKNTIKLHYPCPKALIKFISSMEKERHTKPENTAECSAYL